MPKACWPESSNYPLAIAQQIAVNAALEKKEGLFSVNGPPGTGKTTLLRDVVSDIFFNRALQLAALDDPNDAFLDITYSNYGFTLKSAALCENFFGYEMVVATTNNNAAENVSKELPTLKAINQDAFNANSENLEFN